MVLWPAAVSAGPGVPDVIRENNCGGCHRFSVADSPEEAKGPDLFFAGDKFQKDWLADWLENPVTIRPSGYITDPGFLEGKPRVGRPHPALKPEAAKAAVDYLSALKIPDLVTGKVDGKPLSRGKRARTKMVFERDYGCSACHQTINLAGKIRGGVSGPSLVDAGHRLQADWLYNWLKTPEKFLARGRMPKFHLGDEVMIRLIKFILSMKKENLKEPVNGSIEERK